MSEIEFAGKRVDHTSFKAIPEVADWALELSLRSKLTSESRVRTLGRFVADSGIPVLQIERRAKEKPEAFRKFLSDYAGAQKARGRTAIYVRKVFDVVRAWLDFRDVEFRGFPKLGARTGESIEDEATPTPDDLRALLAALSPRGRLCALLMAHSGLRPGVLGNVDGTDGLRLEDLPELNLETLEFAKVPFLLRVRSSRSKNEKGYLTFGGPELSEALRADLSRRRNDGETLTPKSPVVASLGAGVGKDRRSPKGKGDFVTSKAITTDLRVAIRQVRPGGQTFRPYALRSYFSSQMFAAEARGQMVRDAREAMLGHDLGVSGRYNLSKKLNPTLLEELRSLYQRGYPFLSTVRTQTTTDEDLRRIFVTEFIGVDDADFAKLGPLTNDRIKALIAERKKDEGTSEETAAPGSQKVIAVGAVEEYISKGWRFVAPLNGTKAIVEAPPS
jgi:integrase